MLGGAELSLIDILQEMVSRADVFLISSEDGPLIECCSEMGVSCRVIPCKGNVGEIRREGLLKTALRQWKEILRFVFYVLRLRREIEKINPDLIHANVPKSHIALFIIAALGYRKPTIYHIREIFDRGSLPGHIYSVLFPRKNAAAIAISGAVKDSLPGRVSEKSVLIYNGIQIYPARIPIEGPQVCIWAELFPGKAATCLSMHFQLCLTNTVPMPELSVLSEAPFIGKKATGINSICRLFQKD